MKHIAALELRTLLKHIGSDTILLNVSSPAEHAAKHIPGAVNIPFDMLPSRAGELADKKTIYLHCRSGARSQYAAQVLASLGVTAELVNVDGGIIAWEHAGYPIEAG